MTLDDILKDRPSRCWEAYEKLAACAERRVEHEKIWNECRVVMLSGDCHELVELINRQALEIQELKDTVHFLESVWHH